MKPILSMLLCLFAATAWAADPPAFALYPTQIGWASNPHTVTIRSIGGGKYDGEKTFTSSPVTLPIYSINYVRNGAMASAFAAKVDDSFTFQALTPGRGVPRDANDTVFVVTRFADTMASDVIWTANDVQVKVIDDGGGKYSGQVIVSGNAVTWPIYVAQAFGSGTVAEDALAANVGEIVTLRAIVPMRGALPPDTLNRVFVLLEVNP